MTSAGRTSSLASLQPLTICDDECAHERRSQAQRQSIKGGCSLRPSFIHHKKSYLRTNISKIIERTYPHTNISSHEHILTRTYPHTNISSHERILTRTYPHKNISSHEHILTRTYPHMNISSHEHILTRTYPHTNISSHEHILTQTYPHTNISSQEHILTRTYPHTNISSHEHILTRTALHLESGTLKLFLCIFSLPEKYNQTTLFLPVHSYSSSTRSPRTPKHPTTTLSADLYLHYGDQVYTKGAH